MNPLEIIQTLIDGYEILKKDSNLRIFKVNNIIMDSEGDRIDFNIANFLPSDEFICGEKHVITEYEIKYASFHEEVRILKTSDSYNMGALLKIIEKINELQKQNLGKKNLEEIKK